MQIRLRPRPPCQEYSDSRHPIPFPLHQMPAPVETAEPAFAAGLFQGFPFFRGEHITPNHTHCQQENNQTGSTQYHPKTKDFQLKFRAWNEILTSQFFT